MIFPPTPSRQWLALGLEITRAQKASAISMQPKHFRQYHNYHARFFQPQFALAWAFNNIEMAATG
jgi:hypothetical protein